MCDARCTECGRVSERTLPLRFPHVCLDCLFPELVPEPGHPSARPMSWHEMLEQLHRSAAQRKWKNPL